MPALANRRHLALVYDSVVPLPNHFERWLTYLARNERRAPNTIAARRAALNSLVRHLHSAGVDPLHPTEDHLLAWQAGLDLADGTVDNYTTSVRLVYKFLSSKRGGRILGENPAEELPSIRVDRIARDAIEDDELDLALAAAEHDPRLRLWMLLEAGTGIRPCQIASLTAQRVRYLSNGRAALTVTGKGKSKVVVAGSDLVGDLRQFTRRTRGALWHNADGRPCTGRNIYVAVNRHLADLGLERTSHSLRRWFAAHVYQLTGKDIRAVQELLGHASLIPTMLYVPADEQGRGDIAEQVSARLTRRAVL